MYWNYDTNAFPNIHPDGTASSTSWGTSVRVFEFSQPVTNPILSLFSLGNAGGVMNLATIFPTVWGLLYSANAPNGICSVQGKFIRGAEGFGVVIFVGTYTSISLYTLAPEYYTNYCWGLAATTVTQTNLYQC